MKHEEIVLALERILRDNQDSKNVELLDRLTDALKTTKTSDFSDQWKLEFAIARFDWEKEHSLAIKTWETSRDVENFRAIIAMGQNAIRSCFLINGGAAIAVLTLCGHLVTIAPTAHIVRSYGDPLQFFSCGLLASCVAFGASYISQSLIAYRKNKWGIAFTAVAILLFVSSCVFFYCGCDSIKSLISTM